MPARRLLAGLLEVGLEVADRDVERIDAAGDEVADIAVGVIDETVDDEGIVVKGTGSIHDNSPDRLTRVPVAITYAVVMRRRQRRPADFGLVMKQPADAKPPAPDETGGRSGRYCRPEGCARR